MTRLFFSPTVFFGPPSPGPGGIASVYFCFPLSCLFAGLAFRSCDGPPPCSVSVSFYFTLHLYLFPTRLPPCTQLHLSCLPSLVLFFIRTPALTTFPSFYPLSVGPDNFFPSHQLQLDSRRPPIWFCLPFCPRSQDSSCLS